MTTFTQKVGDRVVVRGCEDDETRIGDVGVVVSDGPHAVGVAFRSKSPQGQGWLSNNGEYPFGWNFFYPTDLETIRPAHTMRDVNGQNISEGDKIVYVTRRGSFMDMIPAVVLEAQGDRIMVRRTGKLWLFADPERKIVLRTPAYIAITERASAAQEKTNA